MHADFSRPESVHEPLTRLDPKESYWAGAVDGPGGTFHAGLEPFLFAFVGRLFALFVWFCLCLSVLFAFVFVIKVYVLFALVLIFVCFAC